jgi:hypothetical protein
VRVVNAVSRFSVGGAAGHDGGGLAEQVRHRVAVRAVGGGHGDLVDEILVGVHLRWAL